MFNSTQPTWFPLYLAALLLSISFAAGQPGRIVQGAEPATSGTPHETVFFAFDDQNLAWQHNLKLTLEPAKKHPANPVLKCGPKGSPDYGHAILYGTVLKIEGKFRMWYLGMIERQLENGQAPGWWRPMWSR